MDRFFLKTLILVMMTQPAWGVSVEDTTPVPQNDLQSQFENSFDVNVFVPDSLSDSDDKVLVNKFADKGLQYLLKSSELRSSPVVLLSETANRKLSGQVALLDHKFEFNVLALQGMAKLKYSGWTNLEIRYQSQQSYLDFGWKF